MRPVVVFPCRDLQVGIPEGRTAGRHKESASKEKK